jgi:hypothetical protein
MSAINFTYDKHCGYLYYSIHELWDFDNGIPKKGWKLIEVVDAEKLPVLAREGNAAMLENKKTHEMVWLHIRKNVGESFDDYINRIIDGKNP